MVILSFFHFYINSMKIYDIRFCESLNTLESFPLRVGYIFPSNKNTIGKPFFSYIERKMDEICF